jgi:hypothetical protein
MSALVTVDEVQKMIETKLDRNEFVFGEQKLIDKLADL